MFGRACTRAGKDREEIAPVGSRTTHTKMKKIYCIALMTAGLLGLSSCSDMTSLNSMSANSLGSVAQVIPGTVVSARVVQVEANDSSKNMGTAIGTALGAGAGSLLGRGKGQIVSTVGFGVVGALAGRGVGAAVGKTKGQELVISADGTKQQYRVIQPIYSQIGAIPVGTHGNLQYGGSESKFLPDGF